MISISDMWKKCEQPWDHPGFYPSTNLFTVVEQFCFEKIIHKRVHLSRWIRPHTNPQGNFTINPLNTTRYRVYPELVEGPIPTTFKITKTFL